MYVIIEQDELFIALAEYMERRGFKLKNGVASLRLVHKQEEGKSHFTATATIEVPDVVHDGPYR